MSHGGRARKLVEMPDLSDQNRMLLIADHIDGLSEQTHEALAEMRQNLNASLARIESGTNATLAAMKADVAASIEHSASDIAGMKRMLTGLLLTFIGILMTAIVGLAVQALG